MRTIEYIVFALFSYGYMQPSCQAKMLAVIGSANH